MYKLPEHTLFLIKISTIFMRPSIKGDKNCILQWNDLELHTAFCRTAVCIDYYTDSVG